ncbi:MAG TPA: hypothetical protein ENH01_02760 [Nitrospirae bacterium]|nr:hypothetical protein [Nitrospirota bacterium]
MTKIKTAVYTQTLFSIKGRDIHAEQIKIITRTKSNKGIYQVKIKFSRHAKRRAKLYKIPDFVISEIPENMKFSHGRNESIKKAAGFKFPLKIIVDMQNE